MKRNSNIELLRIISMIMVIILHGLKSSGALDYSQGVNYWVYWGGEALCIVAVNIFVLISSYFMVSSNSFNALRIVRVLSVVYSYTLICSLMNFIISGVQPSTKEILMMIFPILTKKYWFVNSYLLFYAISPFLNKLLHSLSRKSLEYLILILIIVFPLRLTFLPLSWSQDGLGGYSIVLFIVLYFIAAWIRLYFESGKIQSSEYKPFRFLLLYFLSAGVLLLSKWILMHFLSESYSTKFYSYISIFAIFQSICLFLFFLYKKPLPQSIERVILLASPHSFSAYIIHFSLIGVLFTKVIPLSEYLESIVIYLPLLIISCLTIFSCCVLIDILRGRLFNAIGEIIPADVKDKYFPLLNKWDVIANAVYDEK